MCPLKNKDKNNKTSRKLAGAVVVSFLNTRNHFWFIIPVIFIIIHSKLVMFRYMTELTVELSNWRNSSIEKVKLILIKMGIMRIINMCLKITVLLI